MSSKRLCSPIVSLIGSSRASSRPGYFIYCHSDGQLSPGEREGKIQGGCLHWSHLLNTSLSGTHMLVITDDQLISSSYCFRGANADGVSQAHSRGATVTHPGGQMYLLFTTKPLLGCLSVRRQGSPVERALVSRTTSSVFLPWPGSASYPFLNIFHPVSWTLWLMRALWIGG